MKALEGTAPTGLVVRKLPGGGDIGKRIAKGQRVTGHGTSYDGGWVFVESREFVGWASAQWLRDARGAVEAPAALLRVPTGLVEIRKTFGEPAGPDASAGEAKLPAPLPLAWDKAKKVSRFACHRLMVEPFQGAFAEIHQKGLWALLEDFGGCYNDRNARDLQKKSTHAWGIAVDLNVKSNPLGAKPKMDSRIVSVFGKQGFFWGGRWSRPDGMHFQFAKGY